ncbi:MAG: hypothetical protein V1736_10580 [Pseudomonadota bacterium]
MIEPGIGLVDANGSLSVSPTQNTTYTITATGPGGTSQSSTTVTVLYPPTVSISANPSSIAAGESCTLSWTSSNATSCDIEPGIGPVDPNGSMIVSPAQNTTYIITATGPGGAVTAQAAVVVTSAVEPEPQPDGSFGQRYEDLIPPDATAESYDPKRFSVITGLVKGVDGSAISGVSVTVHDHPEYGTASTDAEGRFSIPIEGGTTFTVSYAKQGLISAQRQVYVPWNDIAVAETVQMISEDPKSTTFTFDGNPGSVITHQSTVINDEFGSRSCSMVLTGDNRAYEADAQGNVIREIATVTTRATEFTTPESMPAKLPPTSAFTYCAELSVDGAQRVKFEKPVITWVNNFLGFPVGEPVPVGYYDRDRGVWVPSDNGTVVRLLDTNGDGIVDALDADGDGQTDDLNGNGSSTDEVQGLNDPAVYQPGTTYWRVAVTHFTPWDCNWPVGPPPDATGPTSSGVADADEQKPDDGDCNTPTGSFVEDRSRILQEDIPIPGTDMTLHYASNRVKGYKIRITVPASGASVPASLKRIVVQVEIAGRTLEQTLEPLPNSTAEFVWDGTDCRGKPVYGDRTAQTSIGYVYDALYYSAADDVNWAFGSAGDTITGVRARQEMTYWKRNRISVGCKTPDSGIAEGFSLSPHHYLMNSILLKGDGSTSSVYTAAIISTIVGIEVSQSLRDIAVDAGGDIYCVQGTVVRQIDTSGSVTTIAGNGAPAGADWIQPCGLDVDSAGNVYVADNVHCMVLKLDKNGIVTRIAGNGRCWFSDNGGLAADAGLSPYDVAVDGAGNVYIADWDGIRKVDTSGIITTVAGGYWDDMGWNFYGTSLGATNIVADGEGNVYYTDPCYSNGGVVCKVDTSGAVTIVAGNGTQGYNGDNIPATAASLYYPERVSTDSLGNLYIADSGNNRIRKVDTSGFVTTIAGNGSSWDSESGGGDGGPATLGSLDYPGGAAVDAAGNLYIAEGNRMRKVARTPSFLSNAANPDEIAFAEDDGIGHVMSLNGNHKKTIDLHTGKVLREFGYDANKELVSITDQFGNVTTISRNSSGVPVSIASPYGLTTWLTIDANNHLTRITYPDESFYTFEYTSGGLMTAKVEPKGNRFERLYDSIGRVTDAFDSEGGHWSFLRTDSPNGDILYQITTGEGNVTSYLDHTYSTGTYTSVITNAGGGSTSVSSAADGLTLTKSLSCGMDLIFNYELDPKYGFKYVKNQSESTPSGLTKTTEWGRTYQDTDANGIPDLITETVTINGKTTAFADNVLQSMKTTTSLTGRTVTNYYDPDTLVTNSVAVPGLYDTNYGYDSRGRLTSVSSNTRQTTFTYDGHGNLESITDPEMHTTTYQYDPVGRVTLIHRPDTSTIGFAYDANGNMRVLNNPVPVNHIFDHNGVNLLHSYETPLSGSYAYVYDKDKRLVHTIFPSGKQINNTYQDIRLTQIQTPEYNIYLDYLCSTKVGAMRKASEEIEYGYDGSLVTSETFSGTLNQSLGYTYNNDFNIIGFSYAGGTVGCSYDHDGLLTGAGTFTIARNAANGLPEAVTGGALNLARSFNGYGETESETCRVNGRAISSWNVTRDNAGRIMSKTQTIDGVTSNYAYTYDPLGRLLTVTKDGTLVEEYRYDAVGTRTYETNVLRGISGRDSTYSDEDHLLTAGTTDYGYDPDGFLTTKENGADATEYDYSSQGELLKVSLPENRVIEYVNDPLGKRIAKKVNGATVEKYLWQGQTRLLAVCDGNDNPIMRFEYADDRMPVAMTKNGARYYLTYDQIGSLRVVANASGNIVKKVNSELVNVVSKCAIFLDNFS